MANLDLALCKGEHILHEWRWTTGFCHEVRVFSNSYDRFRAIIGRSKIPREHTLILKINSWSLRDFICTFKKRSSATTGTLGWRDVCLWLHNPNYRTEMVQAWSWLFLNAKIMTGSFCQIIKLDYVRIRKQHDSPRVPNKLSVDWNDWQLSKIGFT